MRYTIGMILLVGAVLTVCIEEAYASQWKVGAAEQVDTTVVEQGPTSLRVAFDPDLPPFHYEADDGTYTGFTLELFQELAKRQELDVTYIPMNRGQSIAALKDGEIDIILGLSYSSQLHDDMAFTEPFYESSISLIVPDGQTDIESIGDLSGQTVALQSHTVEYDFLQNLRRVRYHVATNQLNALELLEKERAAAFIGNRVTAEYVLERKGVSDAYQMVDGYILPLEYSLAVPQENYELLNILNQGLQDIVTEGIYTDIHNRWFEAEPSPLARQLQLIVYILVFLFIVGLILFLLGLRWNRRLQQEVEKKTKDLKNMNASLEYQIQQTKDSQQFREQILNSSPRGMITCDRQGLITSFNDKAVEISGVKQAPLRAHFADVKIVTYLLADKMDHVLEKGEQFLSKEKLWRRKDGREYYLRYYVYPLYDFRHHIAGVILTFEDMTAEYNLRQQVMSQEKNRALSQLVAGIAHELRNPLTSIKTFVELIPKKMENEHFQRELSIHVPQEIERLNHLVEGLIDYAKPKQRTKERIDVQDVIQSSLILFQRSIENKGFRLETKLESQIEIEVDPNQFKQMIINLLLNAIEALEEKEKEIKSFGYVTSPKRSAAWQSDGLKPTEEPPLSISITAWKWEAQAFIQIVDEGTGMTKDEIQKAIEPFYTTKGKGTGLGLSLTNQFVQENGGRLEITSQKQKGTTMTLIFPLRGNNSETHIDY